MAHQYDFSRNCAADFRAHVHTHSPKQKTIVIECVTVIEEEEVVEEEEIYNEEIGVQDEIETEVSMPDTEEASEMAEEDNPVEDPMLEPEAAPITETGTLAANTKEAPVGARFDGRNPGGRRGLLGRYGGTKSTEDAVEMGLEWLARQQDKKNGANRGSWSLAGPYSDGLEGGEKPNRAHRNGASRFQGPDTRSTRRKSPRRNVLQEKEGKSAEKHQRPQ